MSGFSVVLLAAAVLVELDAAGRRAVGDVADRRQAAGQHVNVDRPRVEFGAVGASEDIRVVTEVDLESVVGGQADVAKVQDDELGPAGGGDVRKVVGPGIGRGRRRARIRADGEGLR
jgi:hypothetical protein